MSDDKVNMESGQATSQGKAQAAREPGAGRISGFATETRELAGDIKEWVDLRVRLVQLEIEERIEKLANRVISWVILSVLMLFTFLFLLLALSAWLSGVTGSEALGHVVVGVGLACVTFLVYKLSPRFMSAETGSTENADLALKGSGEKPVLPPAKEEIDRGEGKNEAE